MNGRLLWARSDALVAQPLDLSTRTLTGEVSVVATGVGFDGVTNQIGGSAALDGLVAYRTSGSTRRQLKWFDRSGKVLGSLGEITNSAFIVRLSPDDQHVLVTRVERNDSDVWSIGVNGRSLKLTSNPAQDRNGVWSSDGTRIVFDSTREGQRDLYVRPADGTGAEALLFRSDSNKTPQSWSSDGNFVLYNDTNVGDVMVLALNGDRKPFPFAAGPAIYRYGQFSPDDRWVSYSSNESGREEIYVRSFTRPGGAPSPDRKVAVSTSGGMFHRWRRDGKAIYYIAPDGYLTEVPVTVTGDRLEPGAPVRLFAPPIIGGAVDSGIGINFDVSRDGRFLINVALDLEAAPIRLVQHWRPAPE